MNLKVNKTRTVALKNTKLKKTDVRWESSDTGTAAVDANGKVTGVSKGEAIIFTDAADSIMNVRLRKNKKRC